MYLRSWSAMLVTIVEVVSCENPRCSEFAKIVDVPRGTRTYYCQTCGCVTQPRCVEVGIAGSEERYSQFLLKELKSTQEW
jgi:hypothetical protein